MAAAVDARRRMSSPAAAGPCAKKSHPAENEQGGDANPPVPIGPYRAPGPRPRPTNAEGGPEPDATASARPLPHAFGASFDDPVAVFRDTNLGAPSTNLNPLDPSSATAGNVVLVSGNRYLAVSTDAGRTFTYKNPVTDIYSSSNPASLANPDGGACCDQVLQYDPRTDRFYWLLQYWCTVQTDCKKRPGENRYRLAVASPKDVAESGGTRWRFWDITSQDVGLKGHWLDFPDLSIGTSFLYLTFNSPSAGSAVWARFKKTSLRDGTLDWWYHRFAGEYLLKPVQNVTRTGYAVRRSSTSELELKRWPERTTNVFSATTPIATTPTKDCSAKSPDGQDFLSDQGCGGFSSSIGGAAMERAGNQDGHIWVAWTSGRRQTGKGLFGLFGPGILRYPQSHVEVAEIAPPSGFLSDQTTIWNEKVAYAYPYLTGGPSGDVAMTYMAGGGGIQYPGWGVALLSNHRSLVRVATGTVGNGRVGDYLAVRPAWPSRTLFAATGNVLTGAGFQPYYALFGRRGDRPPRPPSTFTPPPPSPPPPPPPSPPAPAPDLVMSAFTDQTATVKNVGNAAAGAFFVTVSRGAQMPDTFDVPGLAPGASQTVNFDCFLGSRTATADSNGQVAESDEGNNTRTINTPFCSR